MKWWSNSFLFLLFCSTQQSGLSQNVLISTEANPNETSIIFDYKNPARMVAGANNFNAYHSADSGKTWTRQRLTSQYGVWGDPVVDVDDSGNFFFFHLAREIDFLDRIVCQKSFDGGQTFSQESFAGLNSPKDQDKHWCAIDRRTDNIYLFWTQFDQYGSSDTLDSSLILFSKSVDGAKTWSTPQRISHHAGDCIDEGQTVEGAVPAVGPNGEIYVSWAGPRGIVFNKSLDHGDSWMPIETQVDSMPGGWAFDVPGIYRANGFPITKCDTSGGDYHGTVYINWSDQRNDTDDTEIWLRKSTDGGESWSPRIRVNNDTTRTHQFFTWMDIDQRTGYLYFIFYDRSNYDNAVTDVCIAISTDGGETFTNEIISESPFLPYSGVFFGDYTNIVAHNNLVRPIWTRMDTGQLSVWTDITPRGYPVNVVGPANPAQETEIKTYPNPTKDNAFVSFKLRNDEHVKIVLYDLDGRQLRTVVDEKLNYGGHVVALNLEELNLASGTYLIKLHSDTQDKTLRMLVIE
jgi:hypothetical protein